MFSYLKFWLKSSNQHGLHSPFVYNYLTRGLYETSKKSNNKQLDWILKSIQYFKPKNVFVCGSLEEDLSLFRSLFTNSLTEADIIIIQNYSFLEIKEIVMKMNSKQLLFVCNNMYNPVFQKCLCENDKIVLVVDFYVGSLVSKRTEQLKQNFFLRL